ncbi:hypothetical protein CR513_37296, partial [Mucuna pruriens]
MVSSVRCHFVLGGHRVQVIQAFLPLKLLLSFQINIPDYSLLICSIPTNEDAQRERVYALSPVGQFFSYDNDGSSLPPLSTLIKLYTLILHEGIGGYMFGSVTSGDTILLKFVYHNSLDEDCIKLLRNCHKALPQHENVIVLDKITPEVPNSSNISKHICAVDNLIFLTHDGKERTENKFEIWFLQVSYVANSSDGIL